LPEIVAGQVPAPLVGDVVMAAQGAPLQIGNADHEPAVQVSVVDPLTMPLGQEMVQVPPLGVMLHEPVANCVGGLDSAGHDGLLQVGKADQTPFAQLRVGEPDCRP